MRITQEQRVLEHMLAHGSITSMEAFTLYGITRLSAVIYNLRHDGYEIETADEKTPNRYGVIVYFARYSLKTWQPKGNE